MFPRQQNQDKRLIFYNFLIASFEAIEKKISSWHTPFWHNESQEVGKVLVLFRSPDSVVLDGVIIPDGQGEVIPPGLGVPDQKGAVLVLPK